MGRDAIVHKRRRNSSQKAAGCQTLPLAFQSFEAQLSRNNCAIVDHLSDPTEIPPYHETSIAISLSHCVSCGIADYRCYTTTSFLKKMADRSPKTGLRGGVSQEKFASEAYRALGGVARNSIANRAIVGH